MLHKDEISLIRNQISHIREREISQIEILLTPRFSVWKRWVALIRYLTEEYVQTLKDDYNREIKVYGQEDLFLG